MIVKDEITLFLGLVILNFILSIVFLVLLFFLLYFHN